MGTTNGSMKMEVIVSLLDSMTAMLRDLSYSLKASNSGLDAAADTFEDMADTLYRIVTLMDEDEDDEEDNQ